MPSQYSPRSRCRQFCQCWRQFSHAVLPTQPPQFVRTCVFGVLNPTAVCTWLHHTNHRQRQRRVLCWLCVCSACTKCHQQVCSGTGTAGCGCVCTAPLRHHANECVVGLLWSAKPTPALCFEVRFAAVCFWLCVAGETFSNDELQRGTQSAHRVFLLLSTDEKKHPILSYRVFLLDYWWDQRGSNPRQTD